MACATAAYGDELGTGLFSGVGTWPVIMAVRGISLNVEYAHHLVRFSISMLIGPLHFLHYLSLDLSRLQAKSSPL
jgi:hypothetical protein